jgi:hypothetical protein
MSAFFKRYRISVAYSLEVITGVVSLRISQNIPRVVAKYFV